MKLLIPENIQPDWFPPLYRSRYLYVIHKIQQELYSNGLLPENYCRLDAIILKSLMGTKYKMILQEHQRQEIIQTIPLGAYYGNTVNGYRLGDNFRNVKLRAIEIDDLKLKKRIKVSRQSILPRLEWMKNALTSISLDCTRAIEFNHTTYSNDVNRYNSRYHAIENFRNDTPLLQDNNLSKRVFNSVNILPKDVRHFLTTNSGEELCQLDISGSQLFHFLPMLNQFDGIASANIYGEEIENDIEIFGHLVLSNQIYDFITQGISFTGTHRELKDLFFAGIWYNSPYSEIKSGIKRFFDAEFPNVSMALTHYKKNLPEPYKDKGERFKNFPIHLQAVERENVVDNICRGLVTKYPNRVFIPVHDALICSVSDAKLVKNTMHRFFNNKYGNSPNIKIESI